jgi:two-component system OmpR family response regulator
MMSRKPASWDVHGTSKSSKILCVDDDAYLTDLLHFALAREGHTVVVANSAAAALKAAELDPPDAIILDVHLPDANGFDLCAHFRATMRVPVLLLTASHTEEEMVRGFGQGADDYITKPFSMQVFMLRLRAVLRRANRSSLTAGKAKRTYRLGEAWFDATHNQVHGGGEQISLTLTQGRILHLLLVHEGEVLSAERIMDQLWGYDSETNASVIKTHIRHMRARLALVLGDKQIIQTIPGLGYTFRPPALPLSLAEPNEPEAASG